MVKWIICAGIGGFLVGQLSCMAMISFGFMGDDGDEDEQETEEFEEKEDL